MTANFPKPLLTVPDLSQWLRIEESTIRKRVCYRRIPYIKIGRRVLFRQEEIERWLEENKAGQR
jgi:excisionase family DNA binding protein